MASTSSWIGIGRQVLDQYLQAEGGGGGGDAGQMGVDVFINGFEDEFPGDADDPVAGTYQGYSLEANRASESRPWGGKFGDRPKIHELNQPEAAQILGWRAVEVYGNRNVKSNFQRFVGTPSELRQLIQNYQAMRFITGARIDFEVWFEAWEKGFPVFTANRSDSNYPLNGEKQWERIKDPETRPKYKEWTTPQQRADYGYRVVEVWQNRSIQSDSVLFTGTDLQLIQHCIQLEYEGGGGAGVSKNLNRTWPLLKGQPQIKLYFLGDNKSSGEISLRIMDKSDDPKSPLPNIDKADLRNYAQLIKDIFATPELFTWQKGKEVVSYRNRWQGFEGWYLSKNEAAGRALITKLLAITDKVLDESSLRFTTAPAAAFPSTPLDITVLGDVISQDSERPLVDVKFHRAEIMLPKLKAPIGLVEKTHILYK